MKYVSVGDGDKTEDLLAVSTEDGRVVFYSTSTLRDPEDGDESTIPHAVATAQIGGKQAGFPGRIKDFEVLNLENQPADISKNLLAVTGNSDGVVRIWKINSKSLLSSKGSKGSKAGAETAGQVGTLLTTYETGNRITCLAAFVMLPAEDASTLLDSADEESDEEEEEESESDDDDE